MPSLLSALPSPLWMTAVDMMDEDTFIGAEDHYNLFTVGLLLSCLPPFLPPALPTCHSPLLVLPESF
jgi:hypothetical protein